MIEKYSFPPKVDEWIDRFFKGLEEEPKFFQDTEGHHNIAINLNWKVFGEGKIDQLTSETLRQLLKQENFMTGNPNYKNPIFSEIDSNLNKVRKYLQVVRDFDGNPRKIDSLLDNTSCLHVKGAGILILTQLLAAAHLDEYIVFHDNIYKTLQQLDIIDIGSKKDNGSRYMVINARCRRLYEEKFKERVESSHKFGLQSVHNFLWHYQYYQIKGRWWKKDC
jgi:hypothetical protein